MTWPPSGPGRTRTSCTGVSRPGTRPAASVTAVLAVGPTNSTGTAVREQRVLERLVEPGGSSDHDDVAAAGSLGRSLVTAAPQRRR